MTTIEAARLGQVLVEIADTLVDDFDLVESLQTLTSRAAELTRTHDAGLLLGDESKKLHFMAAFDERIHLLDLYQLSLDEGSCLDCYHLGSRVAADLRVCQTR